MAEDIYLEKILILLFLNSHVFCRLLIFSKQTFSKNSLRNTISVSNSLDPDQARRFVVPELGTNCL